MENKNRGWQRVLLIIIPYLLVIGGFQLIGALIAGIDITSLENENTSVQYLILSLSNLLGTFLLLWIFMKFVDKKRFINLGFEVKNRQKDFMWGFIIGFVLIGLGFISLLYLNQIIIESIVFHPKDLLISIFLFFSIAVVEEVLFRGYVLRNLMISFNKYIALIISALFFALVHGFNPNINLLSMLNLVLAGVLLGITYIHTKNLWFPIALHFSWNLIQTHLGFNVSGQKMYSFIESSVTENNILNGGAFGFEGSIIAVALQVILIIGIERYYYTKSKHNSNINSSLV